MDPLRPQIVSCGSKGSLARTNWLYRASLEITSWYGIRKKPLSLIFLGI